MIEIREAVMEDFDLLLPFYKQAYRPGHPLHNRDFFYWQFGQSLVGKALMALDHGLVVGHLGCNFADGFNWLTNLFILEPSRTGPVVMALYGRAKKMGWPLVTTNANPNAIALYRRMRWYRQPNLERYCLVNPAYKTLDASALTSPVVVTEQFETPNTNHYWKQPGLKGFALKNGSTGFLQSNVAGARLIEANNIEETVATIFAAGYKWIDYVTSWNDAMIDQMLSANWQTEEEANIPWLLNPIATKSKSNITVFSNAPMPRDFIIKRFHSDHGRVPSL